MATSGSTSVKVTNWDTLTFAWWRNAYSVEGNYTDVGWQLQLIATSSGKIISSVPKNWNVTVDGTPYSGQNYIAIENNTTKILAQRCNKSLS